MVLLAVISTAAPEERVAVGAGGDLHPTGETGVRSVPSHLIGDRSRNIADACQLFSGPENDGVPW